MTIDIEDLRRKVSGGTHLELREDFRDYRNKYPQIDDFCHALINAVKTKDIENKKQFNKAFMELHKIFKMADKIKTIILNYHLKTMYSARLIEYTDLKLVEKYLMAKNCRSLSGILEVAIMTGPGEFSCNYDCHYCPKQEGFARSYIKEEPAVRRAEQQGFDPVKQVHTRLISYSLNGHNIDKLEIIVLGGTWSNYPVSYQREFIRDTYYAANVFFDLNRRERYTLEQEKHINETALCKIIGLTLETRPDCITPVEIQRFLEYGVTRVQIGIQHTDDKLLKKINRGCRHKDAQKAIHMLKDSGFKVLGHLMPNLPGATPEGDMEMFNQMIDDPLNQIDEWKIYPTSVTTTSDKDETEVYTQIEKWYREGTYTPYSNDALLMVVAHAMRNVGQSVRIARIFRDIPVANITAGADIPHMRQVCEELLKENGEYCACIRSREIKNMDFHNDELIYDVHEYEGSHNTDYFITATLYNEKSHPMGNIVGFLRLRLKTCKLSAIEVVPEIKGCALVRELHVYGRMRPTYINQLEDPEETQSSQHRGIGRKLLGIAENIAEQNGFSEMAIISGVGVRNYYKKLGYKLDKAFMKKKLNYDWMVLGLYTMYFIIICYNMVSLLYWGKKAPILELERNTSAYLSTMIGAANKTCDIY